jgi:ABC-2 type transport system permease protein
MLIGEWRKWRKTTSVAISRYMAFKADFILMLVAPSFVFVAINYSIWRSIYQSREGASISSFSMDEMLHYQCWAFIVTLLTRSHRTWNLSEHIRLGRITSFLLYPFDAWKFYTSEFVGFQILQLGTAVPSIVALRVFGFIPELDVATCALGVVFSLLVSFLWFVCDFTLGLAAFWLEEVWVFRVIFGLSAALLSGAFIPIELFPPSLQAFIGYTPFPLIASVPVHIFLGTSSVPILGSIMMVCAWTAGLAVVSSVVWRRGIRLYAAAGI